VEELADRHAEGTMSRKRGKETMGVLASDDSWRAREDAETLKRAEEIRADKARAAAAEKELRKTSEAIEKALIRAMTRGKRG
jgi:hypothetical protein